MFCCAERETRKKEFSFILLGLENAGKTAFLKRLMTNEFEAPTPTKGFSTHKFTYDGLTITLADTSGKKERRPYWSEYLHDKDGLIWVIDSSDENRIEESQVELKILVDEVVGPTDLPLLVLCNKSDKQGLSPAAIEARLGLKKLKSKYYSVQGCSAFKGNGVIDGFDWLLGACQPKKK